MDNSNLQEFYHSKYDNDKLLDNFTHYYHNKILDTTQNHLEEENKTLKTQIQSLENTLYQTNMYHSMFMRRYVRVLQFTMKFESFRDRYNSNDCHIKEINKILEELFQEFDNIKP